jgi:NAD(P)H-hydrate epimerase
MSFTKWNVLVLVLTATVSIVSSSLLFASAVCDYKKGGTMARFLPFKQLAIFPWKTRSTSAVSTVVCCCCCLLLAAATTPTPTTALAARPTTATTTTTRLMATSSSSNTPSVALGYLDAAAAAALDAELMQQPGGFSLDQLMELAGLAVAQAAHQLLVDEPVETRHASIALRPSPAKVLLVCGPGNNGGDGLVAARHLHHFGYEAVVVYPKRSSREAHYANLVQQCEDLEIPVLDALPQDLTVYALLVDAIFGFSFVGEPRQPFASMLQAMQHAQRSTVETASTTTATSTGPLILSVDVPSGWHVDEGGDWHPAAVISLTAPKPCMRQYIQGRHFVGGRFLPPRLARAYGVRMPPYEGVSQVWEFPPRGGAAVTATEDVTEDVPWEFEYAAYLAVQEAAQQRAEESAVAESIPKGETEKKVSWEAEYASYCAEKEARLLAAQDRAKRS